MEATANLRNDELLKKGRRWLIAGIVIQIAIDLISKIVLAWAYQKCNELGRYGWDWYIHFLPTFSGARFYFRTVALLVCFLISFLYLRKHGSYAIRDFSLLFFVSQCVMLVRLILPPIASVTNSLIVDSLFWIIGSFILLMSFATLFRNKSIKSLHKNTIIVLCVITFVSMADIVCEYSLHITNRMHDASNVILNPLSSIFFYVSLLIKILYIVFYKRLLATPSAIVDDNDVPSHRFRPSKVEIGAFVAIALCFAFSMLIINKVCLTI